MALDFTFRLDQTEHSVGIAARRPQLALTVDGRSYQVSEAGALAGEQWLLTVDDRTYVVWRTQEGERMHLHIGGRSYSVGHADAISAAREAAGGEDTLRADMPGVVVAVHATADAEVAPGDVLLVIESMKMQINIVAHRAGRIDRVHVAQNQSFEKGAELVSLHAEA